MAFDWHHTIVGVLGGLVLIVAAVLVNRAIGTRMKLNRLRSERAAAAEVDRLKAAFLTNVGHELRTPLNAIIGFSNVLLKNKDAVLREAELSYVSRIAANGAHLLRVIDDILEIARLEGGASTFSICAFEVGSLVRETLSELRSAAEAREVRLIADLPPHVVPLATDRARVKQILVNLIGNAVKFARRGDVTVRVTADPDTCHLTRIDVIDWGIGIPADRLAAIFESFQQADMSLSRQYGGTGLGLAITRSLARSLGWSIEVASTPGVGSTFSVALEGER
jgi:signal transduction histidine kinase